jgi:hypothetical protein
MWTEQLQGVIDYLALAWQNNFFLRILIIRGMTFKFEYLGEFEFIFKNNLGAWSRAQELAFDEKKRMSKILCKCTFTYPDSQITTEFPHIHNHRISALGGGVCTS